MDVAQKELLSVLPRDGEWTDADYLWVSRSSRRLIELARGTLEFPPMPTAQHQFIVGALFVALRTFLLPRGGAVLFAPLRLKVAEGRFREPDLVALRDAQDGRSQDDFWSGADFVVEVVSPDDPNRDLVTKRAEYAAASIPEYWIVDPRDASVRVLTLDGGSYRDDQLVTVGTVHSRVFGGFSVAAETLFPSH
ncbi:MAG: hypothetical protein AMXMBFR34_39430 [Myxococcaceae bacterium]